ncbi:hypothetical protein BKA62DRAFT_726182 [Auriculariales sp. MPI-PUGE-AT-0066]|nr:hypothetical protein BKA62DRAFT_726182 [Auriculariales sp. MPI-PUGE-AT-0066]
MFARRRGERDSSNGTLPVWLVPGHKSARPALLALSAVAVTVALAALYAHANTAWSIKHAAFGEPILWSAARSRHRLNRAQGLLFASDAAVGIDAQHPIADVIQRAEETWQGKVLRQSKSLKEGYHEYIRRYKRRPPKGFDSWWKWCKDHDVQLLDEFDQLDIDFEIFWGMKPSDMRASQRSWESHIDVFTVGQNDETGKLEMLSANLSDSRDDWHARLHIPVIEPIQEFLPKFRATWAAPDTPRMIFSWDMLDKSRKAFEAGNYAEFVQSSEQVTASGGWEVACPPTSPARTTFNASDKYHTQASFMEQPKSFIADMRASMDPCNTPELLHLTTYADYPHGPPMHTGAPVPEFARSKTMLGPQILGVPVEEVVGEPDDPLPWREKPDQRMVWRGRTTGVDTGPTAPNPQDIPDKAWNMTHRPRFVQLTNAKEGTVKVYSPNLKLEQPKEWPLADLNEFYFNTAYVDALQCEENSTCLDYTAGYTFKDLVHPPDGQKYKYVWDMDGNGWSARFRRLMMRHSLVLKSTIYPEWWTDRAQAWVHYVPVKVDYGDLYDIMAFFRGFPDGTPGNDAMAEKIATAGRDWAKRFWRDEDVTAYTWRMYLEYVRLMSDDRTTGAMDFTMPIN